MKLGCGEWRRERREVLNVGHQERRCREKKVPAGSPVGRSLQKSWYQAMAPDWAVW